MGARRGRGIRWGMMLTYNTNANTNANTNTNTNTNTTSNTTTSTTTNANKFYTTGLQSISG